MIEPGTLFGVSYWIAFGFYNIENERRTYDVTLFIDDVQILFHPDYTNYETFREIILT